jgi:hypothetical protein
MHKQMQTHMQTCTKHIANYVHDNGNGKSKFNSFTGERCKFCGPHASHAYEECRRKHEAQHTLDVHKLHDRRDQKSTTKNSRFQPYHTATASDLPNHACDHDDKLRCLQDLRHLDLKDIDRGVYTAATTRS